MECVLMPHRPGSWLARWAQAPWTVSSAQQDCQGSEALAWSSVIKPECPFHEVPVLQHEAWAGQAERAAQRTCPGPPRPPVQGDLLGPHTLLPSLGALFAAPSSTLGQKGCLHCPGLWASSAAQASRAPGGVWLDRRGPLAPQSSGLLCPPQLWEGSTHCH